MKKSQAFTLIELMVVITIIAILAGVAMPAFQAALLRARQMAALEQARQIGLALRMYSNDHDGTFPTGSNSYGETIATSNDAFRSLVPAYIDDETVFAVSRSKFGPKADGKFKEPVDILRPGENHFAVIEGLNSTSTSTWPLVVDGTDGTGKYSDNEADLAGTWKGTRAIVVTLGGSAALVPLHGSGTAKYIPRVDDPTLNALDTAAYMGVKTRLLEPAR